MRNGNVEYCVHESSWGNSYENWFSYDEYKKDYGETSALDEYEQLYKKQYVVEKVVAKRIRVEYLVLYKNQSFKALEDISKAILRNCWNLLSRKNSFLAISIFETFQSFSYIYQNLLETF